MIIILFQDHHKLLLKFQESLLDNSRMIDDIANPGRVPSKHTVKNDKLGKLINEERFFAGILRQNLASEVFPLL